MTMPALLIAKKPKIDLQSGDINASNIPAATVSEFFVKTIHAYNLHLAFILY